MQILKMTWKIDYIDISMKKSKRGIGSQVSNKDVKFSVRIYQQQLETSVTI